MKIFYQYHQEVPVLSVQSTNPLMYIGDVSSLDWRLLWNVTSCYVQLKQKYYYGNLLPIYFMLVCQIERKRHWSLINFPDLWQLCCALLEVVRAVSWTLETVICIALLLRWWREIYCCLDPMFFRYQNG